MATSACSTWVLRRTPKRQNQSRMGSSDTLWTDLGHRFMPNIGKYMINVLKTESNGSEMDRAWCWKSKAEIEAARDRHTESKELRHYDTGSIPKL